MTHIRLMLAAVATMAVAGCGSQIAQDEQSSAPDAAAQAAGTAEEYPDVSGEEFRATVKNDSLVLAKFGAPWCGPCRAVDPELAELESANGGKLTVLRINVDEEPELAEEYDVSGIPKLLLFQNGQPVVEWLGYEEAEVFQASIDTALAKMAPVGEVRENALAE